MKTRFSPSPTGRMHLGNIRTALYNYLASIAYQGSFLLRIEDTDRERSRDEHTRGIEEDLAWLGVVWQEGPGVGGEHGPYFQSEREAIYNRYYQLLIDNGHAYPCFCQEEQLALARKVQRAQGQAPRYAGTCRHLSAAEIAAKEAQGIRPALRFKMPSVKMIEFVDVVKGLQSFFSDDIGDFIIRRADGMTTFMYCNAIDDSLMGTTLALRGEDHLTNTPRQLAILQALGLRAPQYGHIALVVADDGSPFSKRHGSKSVQELREQGFLALAITNYLSRVGHHYETQTLLPLNELGKQFRLEALSQSASRYDEQQLLYWQKEVVMQLDQASFYAWAGKIDVPDATLFYETVRRNVLFPHDVREWQRIFFTSWQLDEAARVDIQHAGREFFTIALSAIDSVEDVTFAVIADAVKAATGKKGRALLMPLRLAFTGCAHGPEMSLVVQCMGVVRIKAQLQQALSLC